MDVRWSAVGSSLQVGESACWDESEQALYTVDVWGHALHRFVPSSKMEFMIAAGEMACAVFLGIKGRPIAALERRLVVVDSNNGRLVPLVDGPVPTTHRFNDAVVDPAGRLIIGTMRLSQLGADATGRLLSFGEGEWKTLLRGFWTVNGLAFSPDGRTIYVSDSHPSVATVWKAPYDVTSGKVGPREVFATFDARAGRPDGAAIDANGNYWIAGVGGGTLYCFAPDGKLSREVSLPVENPTKPAFGGKAFDSLFITSMSIKQSRPDVAGMAGRTLCLEDVGRGVAASRFRY